MIAPQELRIGNWYKQLVSGRYAQVDAFIFGEIYDDASFIDYMMPIPLTPEILEKCGFENDNDWWRIEDVNKNELSKNFEYDGFSINNNYFPTKCKYLHQLQNLFYSLTNEELNINL